MAAKRTARIAFGLIAELAERLERAGAGECCCATVGEAIDLVWPMARRLAKLEKSGKAAGKAAVRARARVLDLAVSHYAPSASPWQQFRQFRPYEWHVALVPGPAPERAREAA